MNASKNSTHIQVAHEPLSYSLQSSIRISWLLIVGLESVASTSDSWANRCLRCSFKQRFCYRPKLTKTCAVTHYTIFMQLVSLAVQLRLEVIPINCIVDIVAIVLDIRTLLSVSSTCGTVFQQIVWTFFSFVAFKRTDKQIDFTLFVSC